MWERIDEDLERERIAEAAGRLRRGSEAFFSTVCDALQVPVVYKQNGRYELGDFLGPAVGEYRDLLKAAIASARSWGFQETLDRLVEIESVAKSVYARTNAEQWAVNANVHYNNWADFTAKDFRPVVDAFHDLYRIFLCSKCDRVLFRLKLGAETVGVRCGCGAVDWNLVKADRRHSGAN